MEIYGYEIENDNLLTLKEVTFVATIGELDKLIQFLQYVKEIHTEHVHGGEYCHTHYRDWDMKWKKGLPDIIVVSNIDEE